MVERTIIDCTMICSGYELAHQPEVRLVIFIYLSNIWECLVQGDLISVPLYVYSQTLWLSLVLHWPLTLAMSTPVISTPGEPPQTPSREGEWGQRQWTLPGCTQGGQLSCCFSCRENHSPTGDSNVCTTLTSAWPCPQASHILPPSPSSITHSPTPPPPPPPPPLPPSSGPETKNHFRENHHRIRQIQSRRKQREEEEEVKPVHIKSDKYDHVQPKVTVYMQVWHMWLVCSTQSFTCHSLVSSTLGPSRFHLPHTSPLLLSPHTHLMYLYPN